MKKNILLIIVLFNAFFLYAEDTQIHKTTTNGMVYYHIKYILTPENTFLPNDPKIVAEMGLKRNAANYRDEILDEQSVNFKKYGQFEIFIPAKKFPCKGSHKSGYIILRMPQTLVDNKYSDDSKDPRRYDYVAEKQALYNKIKTMKELGQGSVAIIIELNPYVEVKSKKPLELELTQPNVFFRTAYGRYIDYVGQLYSPKPRINKELFKRIGNK
ncbi:MAG: hypothetical protein K9L99_05740 [Candidatus Omnitrophica bacterium]|nr:hypothetical protein [Candidatus Omnitrophota bacterium]